MQRGIAVILCAALLCGAAAFCGCEEKAERVTYAIEAEYLPESAEVRADMQVTFTNTEKTEIDVLKFNLYANAYREGAKYSPVSAAYTAVAYYGGKSYGKIEISSVEGDILSWTVAGEDQNILAVTLASPLRVNESAELKIGFTTLLAKVDHRTGVGRNTVNFGNFYPILCAYEEDTGFYECVYYNDGDPFYSECANYRVEFTLPREYKLAVSGESDCVYRAEKAVYSASVDCARDFAAVASKDFKTLQKSVRGINLTYWYYADEAPEETLKIAAESLAYFSEQFGAYPYASLSVVESSFCYGGMEYPALTMISDSLTKSDREYTVVHENAHQWWYAAVGNNQLQDAWMDEGLAEYSCALFYDAHAEYGISRQTLVSSALTAYKAYCSVYGQIFGKTDTTMDRDLGRYISEYEYVSIAYRKGMILFDNLRVSIGDEKFTDGLKNYYRSNLYSVATVQDMIAAFERTGVDVAGYFDSFIKGRVIL